MLHGNPSLKTMMLQFDNPDAKSFRKAENGYVACGLMETALGSTEREAFSPQQSRKKCVKAGKSVNGSHASCSDTGDQDRLGMCLNYDRPCVVKLQ